MTAFTIFPMFVCCVLSLAGDTFVACYQNTVQYHNRDFSADVYNCDNVDIEIKVVAQEISCQKRRWTT